LSLPSFLAFILAVVFSLSSFREAGGPAFALILAFVLRAHPSQLHREGWDLPLTSQFS